MVRGSFPKGSVASMMGREGPRMVGSPSVGWSPSWRLVAAIGSDGGDDWGFKWLHPTMGGCYSPYTIVVRASTCWSRMASKFCLVIFNGRGGVVGPTPG